MERAGIVFFDPHENWLIYERALPHWSQAGTLCFVTWRAGDSLPKSALSRLDREIAEIVRSHGLSPNGVWQNELKHLSRIQRGRIQWQLFATKDKYLDRGYGECLLERPELSEIVEESLRKFDGDRYILTDSVVMPNHVHFLAAFEDESRFLKQNEEWKRYTARAINKVIGRKGQLWQVDQFDHLIRSPEQFEHYRRYIADNPRAAFLSPGQFRYYRSNA